LTPTTPQQQYFWHQDLNNEFMAPTTPSYLQNGFFNKIYCNLCKGQYIVLNGGDYIQCFCGVKPRSCLQNIENPQNFNITYNKAEDIKMVKVCQSNGTNSMQTVPLKEFRRMIGLKDHRRNNSLNLSSEINQQQSNRNVPINFNNNNNTNTSYNRTLSLQHQQMIIQPQYSNNHKSLPIFNSNRPIQQQQQTRWQQPISFIKNPLNQTTNSINNKQMNFKYYQQQVPTPQHIFEFNQNLIKNEQLQQQQYNHFQTAQQFGYNGVSFELRQLIPSQNNNIDVQQSLQTQQQQPQSYNSNDNFNYYPPIQRYNQIQQQPDLQNLSSSSSSSSSSSTSSASSTVQQQQQQQQINNNSNIDNNHMFTPATLYVPINQQPISIQSQTNLPNMILSTLNDEMKYEIF
jgi:hypothetical protein